MSQIVVLAVGLESSLLATQSSVWKSAGYVVTPVGSITDAINHFKYGDFDLVLLGPSVTLGNREKLISLIRASGSKTPIVPIGNYFADYSLPDSSVKEDSTALLAGVGQVLARKAKGAVAQTILNSDGRKIAVA